LSTCREIDHFSETLSGNDFGPWVPADTSDATREVDVQEALIFCFQERLYRAIEVHRVGQRDAQCDAKIL
jgi:hypothetical protein